MPVVQPTATSPPPREATMGKAAPSPPPAMSSSSSSSTNILASGTNLTSSHQVGTRQATRSRTRTRQSQQTNGNGIACAPGPSRPGAGSLLRHNSEDHPLSAHKLAAKGYHSFLCLGIPFHVKKRYTFLRELGIGAYGCVALARDHLLDCNVAIKKVTRVFERDVLARRALREVAVLRHIGLCDNVTALLDFDTAFIDFHEIYLVLEASEADLSQIIRSGQALSDAHLQYFAAQILRGVRYMHASNVIHRDLKPGNLLVNADCQLKLCDFGLARAHAAATEESAGKSPETGDAGTTSPCMGRAFPESPKSTSPSSPTANVASEQPSRLQTTALDFPGGPLTEYVATRWYRAPEIMLCFRKGYGPQIDMWAVGCILAELLGGKPIFAGKDYVDQIARINNVLGSPDAETIAKIGSERAKTYVQSLPNMPAVPFGKLYSTASPQAIDLLSKLLRWDPEDRISASEALKHPWLKAYHKSNNNWIPPPPFSRFAEVEMLQTIGDFRLGLETESDELRAEIESMEADEAAAVEAADRENQLPASTTEAKYGDASKKHGGSHPPSADHSYPTKPEAIRSSSSAVGSPVPTPSSLATSANETSPTYETDLTSASAPHSVNGSNSAKRSKMRIIDGLGLLPNEPQQGHGSQQSLTHTKAGEGSQALRERRALDETLANHGLLCGDVVSQADLVSSHRSTFRRRAVTNAPAKAVSLKRHGSQCDARSAFVSSRKQDAMIEDANHSADIIQRSGMQREEHPSVIDLTSSIASWLWLSSSDWADRSRKRLQGHTTVDMDNSMSCLHSASREGSDTTAVGFQGNGTPTTAQRSPFEE